MFQLFTAETSPENGAARLAALRAVMVSEGLAGYIVPQTDVHQGEYLAPRDARLAWLTGFTGSAGFAIVLNNMAGIFIDGRYRVQVRAEVDLAVFTPVHWPETKPADWLVEHLPKGGRVGFDPWLHSQKQIVELEAALEEHGLTLCPTRNFVDQIWADQPGAALAAAAIHPLEFAGEASSAKRARLAEALCKAGHKAAVLTLTDSIAWLLNIRGADIAHNPVVQAFAVLHDTGNLTLFAAAEKFGPKLLAHFGAQVRLRPFAAFAPALRGLVGPVRVDPASVPRQVVLELQEAGVAVTFADDPCILPKACKNPVELAGARAAHQRDGAAMVEFLAWLEAQAPQGDLTEIDVVKRLEGFRAATNALREIAFDTICGAGANGAIVHYRVSEASNAPIRPGELLLVDSGGQYADGTTDITRTLAVGAVREDARAPYTRVLQGMITLSRLRFPKGLAGRDIEALARAPLWLAGQDYDHGTGHGVGSYLCVHEGPARLSRLSEVPLAPGMILSNEPGYYREGAFGIRIENLMVVAEAPALAGADAREMLAFETLTLVPIDTRLVMVDMLTGPERDWLNAYHARVLAEVGPRVSPEAAAWLVQACAPV
ncbi:MAG: aminopeptidase P family protein [Rhodobacteraceae bacterium]|nr:aminopeptidase P family protein [Paracoccaceae bacterium]